MAGSAGTRPWEVEGKKKPECFNGKCVAGSAGTRPSALHLVGLCWEKLLRWDVSALSLLCLKK